MINDREQSEDKVHHRIRKALEAEANPRTTQTDWKNTKTNDLVVSAYRASMGDDVADVVTAVHNAQDSLRTNTRQLSKKKVEDLRSISG